MTFGIISIVITLAIVMTVAAAGSSEGRTDP